MNHHLNRWVQGSDEKGLSLNRIPKKSAKSVTDSLTFHMIIVTFVVRAPPIITADVAQITLLRDVKSATSMQMFLLTIAISVVHHHLITTDDVSRARLKRLEKINRITKGTMATEMMTE